MYVFYVTSSQEIDSLSTRTEQLEFLTTTFGNEHRLGMPTFYIFRLQCTNCFPIVEQKIAVQSQLNRNEIAGSLLRGFEIVFKIAAKTASEIADVNGPLRSARARGLVLETSPCNNSHGYVGTSLGISPFM